MMCQPNCDFTGADVRADRQRERRGLERRHHLTRAEEPELAALVLGRRIGRILLGEIGEVAAGLQLRLDRVGRFLIGDENVARAHLRGLVERGVVLVEVRLDVGVGRRAPSARRPSR